MDGSDASFAVAYTCMMAAVGQCRQVMVARSTSRRDCLNVVDVPLVYFEVIPLPELRKVGQCQQVLVSKSTSRHVMWVFLP